MDARKFSIVSLFLILSIGLAGLTVVNGADTAGNATDAPAVKAVDKKADESNDSKDMPKQMTFRGQVVNFHAFLTKQKAPVYRDDKDDRSGSEKLLGTLTTEVPIGLWVHESDALKKLIPGRPVHLIFFDPEVSEQINAYQSARTMMGKTVWITGRLYNREGVSGIMIEKITELNTAGKSE